MHKLTEGSCQIADRDITVLTELESTDKRFPKLTEVKRFVAQAVPSASVNLRLKKWGRIGADRPKGDGQPESRH
ncbi:hypothetical protein PXNS11_350141 [Stutzerimonas xanthomarina]|nr:hypothetical protein PXNS11_350141 [Stutzerimonas xanthomarina]